MVSLGKWKSCYYFHASSKISELNPKDIQHPLRIILQAKKRISGGKKRKKDIFRIINKIAACMASCGSLSATRKHWEKKK